MPSVVCFNGQKNKEFFCWLPNGKSCVAYHEAGHAVAAWLLCVDIDSISVMDEFGFLGEKHALDEECIGAVYHSFCCTWDLKRLRESKSGIIENGRRISFIEFHADAIKRDIQRNLFISLAGPVCEVEYGGGNIFSPACSFSKCSPGSDRAKVEEMLDSFCECYQETVRDDMLQHMINKTESLVKQHWNKVEKLACILERNHFIRGHSLNQILGINFVDRATPFFEQESTCSGASTGFNG
ncbi:MULTISPECIES: peptidase M41 family protein [Enterobacteriaceae]|uniref:peptidase M41 family protein n=1 Tax=Enterobacteriaceae TaxID=543 RepID=UPI0012FDE435|nr:peptidase M41 family protein [Escherichia coli]EFN5562458.1 peptidase M41 family protein [Escherichia coli]ELN7482422.1 peptidase M41 family protein [Escherichia coli]HAY5638775.1 peptidase M41 family protein [Escherichia coli]HCQ0228949.1 peptidase M41 family protein [Escherichia coli]